MSDLSRLQDVLEAERSALLAGDLNMIGALLPQKEALIEQANWAGADRLVLQQAENALARNQDLLKAAMEGIGTVKERLAALAAVDSALETYGADGQKHHIRTNAAHKVEKRA